MTQHQDNEELQEHAARIASEIFYLINQYTHDNIQSKFFLPEEISQSFYVAAGGFAAVIYIPQLESDEIQQTYALLLFLILITYGFQIYLKERSLKTNSSPYTLPTDIQIIDSVRQTVFQQAEEGELQSSKLAQAVIDIAISHFSTTVHIENLQLKDHITDETKLNNYMTIALYYGYNIAFHLLQEE